MSGGQVSLELGAGNHLGQLADAAHDRLTAHFTNAALSVVELGRICLKAREKLKHGQWSKWVEARPFSLRTAQRCMQLVREGVTPDEIAKAGGVNAVLRILAGKHATVARLGPGEDAEPDASEPPDTAEAEAVLASVEGKWQGNTPEPREADTESAPKPKPKRKPNRAKVQPEATNERLQLDCDSLAGRVAALESLLEACREGREVVGASLG